MAIELTPEQAAVIANPANRHARVLAGPGTGKSSTVIHLARRLQDEGVAGVRLVTFTRAASGELAGKVLQHSAEGLTASTIHSFAIGILLANPGSSSLPEPLRLVDDWEWKQLIRPLFCRQLGLRGQEWRLVDEFKREMSANWESLSSHESPKIDTALRARFMAAWDRQRMLFGYSLISEIPYRLRQALREHPDLALNNLKVLVIDEYQDLNACDLVCLDLLAERGVTLVAVGDDDQSIYSFRKAHPAGIREFPQKHSAADYQLTTNHRCGRRILEWADWVISQDLDRGPKAATRPSEHNADGEVAYLEFAGETTEANGVVGLVKHLHDAKSVPLREILVLTRTDTVSKPIEEALEKAGVAYVCPDALQDQLEVPAVRELLARLRLVTDFEDSVAWWTLLELTLRVTATHIDALLDSARASGTRVGPHLLRLHGESKLESLIGKAGVLRVERAIAEREAIVVPETGPWGKWIGDMIREGKLPTIPDETIELLGKLDALARDEADLARFVSQIYPLTKDLAATQDMDAVRLMTIASSKGLTARACIMAGCEDNIMPHPKGDRDEERRLLYVGMTRAQEFLFLTRARRRRGITARVGRSAVQQRRPSCPFLEGGPIEPTDGLGYLRGIGVT